MARKAEPSASDRPKLAHSRAGALYRAAFERSGQAMLIFDAAGRCLDANAAARHLLGYGRAELADLAYGDLVATQPALPNQGLVAPGQQGSNWHGEIEVRRKDGSLLPVEAWRTTVERPSGAAWVVTWEDMSERRAREQMQREFILLIGHEMRHPLSTIRAHAELMLEENGRSERTARTILAKVGQLERLIGDLMYLLRLEGGRLELRRTRLDLVALVRAVAEQASAQSSKHTVQVDAPEGGLFGLWDRDRLEQILQNLLSNAIKYSPRGGEIFVRVTDWGEVARVSVTDEGIGIAQDALTRVFDRFYRTESAVRSRRGFGLGLYVNKLLVEAHGGQMWAESAGEGKGSTFAFTLPYGPL